MIIVSRKIPCHCRVNAEFSCRRRGAEARGAEARGGPGREQGRSRLTVLTKLKGSLAVVIVRFLVEGPEEEQQEAAEIPKKKKKNPGKNQRDHMKRQKLAAAVARPCIFVHCVLVSEAACHTTAG